LFSGCGEEDPVGPSGSEEWLDPSVAPRVVATYPPDGGVGPYNLYVQGFESRPHLTIQLNKLVERSRFRQDWFVVEGFADPLRVDLFDGSSGSLTPILNLRLRSQATYGPVYYEIGKSYAVSVDTTLRDFTGRHPAAPYRFSFTPEPHFRVASAVFASKFSQEQVSPQDQVVVFFNSRPRADIGTSITFTPASPGRWDRLDGYARIVFRHSQPFAFGATYSLRIETTATDTLGHALPTPFETRFEVQGFAIKGSAPEDGEGAVAPYQSLSVAATGVVDSTSVAAALQVVPAAPGRLTHWSTGFGLRPDQDLLAETTYTVTVSTALRAWEGTALGAPYRFSFTTDSFRVTYTQPYDSWTGVGRMDSVSVSFNAHLDMTTVPASFAMVPNALGTIVVSEDWPSIVFRPSVPLEPNTTYQVTIGTGLRSQRGDALREPYTFQFTTVPY
jgi:hypothetical protein